AQARGPGAPAVVNRRRRSSVVGPYPDSRTLWARSPSRTSPRFHDSTAAPNWRPPPRPRGTSAGAHSGAFEVTPCALSPDPPTRSTSQLHRPSSRISVLSVASSRHVLGSIGEPSDRSGSRRPWVPEPRLPEPGPEPGGPPRTCAHTGEAASTAANAVAATTRGFVMRGDDRGGVESAGMESARDGSGGV